jgi:hypothetical protein
VDLEIVSTDKSVGNPYPCIRQARIFPWIQKSASTDTDMSTVTADMDMDMSTLTVTSRLIDDRKGQSNQGACH